MRTWGRSPINVLCGKCGATIHQSEPHQVLSFIGRAFTKVRCRACADEPVPGDLQQQPTPIVRVAAAAAASSRALPFDGKAAGAGEDR